LIEIIEERELFAKTSKHLTEEEKRKILKERGEERKRVKQERLEEAKRLADEEQQFKISLQNTLNSISDAIKQNAQMFNVLLLFIQGVQKNELDRNETSKTNANVIQSTSSNIDNS